MADKLILRTLISPYIDEFADITKGSELNAEEFDSNLLYLKGELIYKTSISDDNIIVLNKINGDTIEIPPQPTNWNESDW